MSIRIPPRWNQRDSDGRRHRDTESGARVDESGRTVGWSFPERLPENPDERRIRNRLIVLAAALPIVQVLRWLFG